ncbi:hypothetical protein MPSEU_000746600 [Mayamaea pseudoterrestris]|nr:hypothetical protein MPSEU_000746600 [Mayamaea pseudoterrestris]
MGCCDPCGNLARLAIIALTAIGITLQTFSSKECDWIRYTSDETDESGSFGPFYWQLVGSSNCTEYGASNVESDTLLRASRSMMVLALICAFVGGCMVVFEFLCCKVPCAGCLESLSYGAAIVCSSLIYTAFGSKLCYENSFDCSFGMGSSYNLMALAAYGGAWVVLCCSPKPTPLIGQCRKN